MNTKTIELVLHETGEVKKIRTDMDEFLLSVQNQTNENGKEERWIDISLYGLTNYEEVVLSFKEAFTIYTDAFEWHIEYNDEKGQLQSRYIRAERLYYQKDKNVIEFYGHMCHPEFVNVDNLVDIFPEREYKYEYIIHGDDVVDFMEPELKTFATYEEAVKQIAEWEEVDEKEGFDEVNYQIEAKVVWL